MEGEGEREGWTEGRDGGREGERWMEGGGREREGPSGLVCSVWKSFILAEGRGGGGE